MAIFAIALAVAGLAVGVVHVGRSVELGLFCIAVGLALAAMWRILARLLGENVGEPTPFLPAGTRSSRRRLQRERTAATRTMLLLAGALLFGLSVAVVRSGGASPPHGGRLPPGLIAALERLSRSGGLRVQSSGGDPRALIAGLAGAGILLILAGAALMFRTRRVAAAAVGGAGAASVAAALALSIGDVAHPQLDIAPTLRIDQPTLFSFQLRPANVTVPSHVTVQSHVMVSGPPDLRPFTLLSLGGLRISIRLHRRAHCGCARTLPPTR